MLPARPEWGQLVEALSRALERAVAPSDVEPLGLWAVARVHLGGADGLPPSVIVKWLRQNDEGFRTNPAQLTRERDALTYLADLDLNLAPRLLGYDEKLGVLVIEDLSPASVLWDVLGRDGERGQAGLVAFAGLLGRLHAATVGRADEFHELVGRSTPVDPAGDRRMINGSPWDWQLADLADVGFAVTPGAQGDMATVRDVLLEPGPLMAMSNGDAGANNVMLDDTGARIIDWEMAGFRHPMIDVACLHVPGPMWMTISEPGPEIDEAYRNARSVGGGASADDGADALALVAACLASALERARRIPRLDRRQPGHHSRPQMIATLESAARAAQQRSVLPGLTEWTADLAAHLRRRWPDADVDLPNAYTRRE